MNTKQTFGLCTVLLFALFATIVQGQPQRAVLNARQLGIDDLELLDDESDGDYVDDVEAVDEDSDDEYVDDEEESSGDDEEVAEDDEEFVEDEEEEVAEDDEEVAEDDEEFAEDEEEEVAEDDEEVAEDDEEVAEDDEEVVEDDEEVVEDEDEEVAEDEDEEVVEDEDEEVVEDDEEVVEDEDEEVAEDEDEEVVEDEDEEVAEDEDEEAVEDEDEEVVEDEDEEVAEDEDEEVVEEEDAEVVEDEDEEVAEDEEEEVVEDEEEEIVEDEEEEVVEDEEEEVVEDEEEEAVEDEEEEVVEDEEEEVVEDEEEEVVEDEEEEVVEDEEEEVVEDEEVEEEPFTLDEDEVEENETPFDLEEEDDEETETPFDLEEEEEGGDTEVAPPAPAEVDPLEKSLSEIELLERIRRQMFDQHGRESLAEGQRAIQNGSWGLAIEKFKNALEFLQDKESTHGLRQQAYEGLAEAYYRKALDETDFKSYEEAEKSIREARGYIDSTSPLYSKTEALLKRVRDLKENPPVEPPPPRVSRWNQKEFREQREDFSKRMSIAREHYTTGEYRDARMHVEAILAKDPYYAPAIDLLRKIHLVEHRYADKERETTRDGMIKDVTRSWTARTYGTDFASLGAEVQRVDPNEANQRIKATTDEVRIREKMKSIMLESIEYRQANIVDVINELSDLSRENDLSETAAEEKGINFMLNIGPDTATADATAAAPADDSGFWGEADAGDAGGDGSYAGIPPLTIKARYINLQTALDMIMEVSGLKYRINGNIVMIMRKNATLDEMQHRMYSVLPTIQEVQLTLGSARADGGGGTDDPWRLDAGEAKRNDDWKSFFGDLGVGWPDGSTVKYMPSIGKLVVRNTPDNLATLEQVLGALNVTPFQVEIEVRFVEVSQLDLNSLGLEWILNDDYELIENKTDRNLPPASRRRGVIEAGSFTRGFNYLNKNTRLGVNDGSGVMDNIATFTSILTNPQFSLVLHALSNRSNTDMLSAPKVTARTGTTATIKTVTEYVYPTEYEVTWPEDSDSNTVILQDGSTGSMTLPAVEPQEFNMREVGVILQVTPNVSSDGTRISLELQPTVVSDPSWKDYGYTYPIDYRSGEGFHLTMEQPFFPVRSLATQVDIYNGCTVAMGGMIREERFTEEDKIPILGDIPLIGRLFRYKYEQSDKRNLLIFVTARLVDPAGREITGGAAEMLTGVQSDTKQ